MLHSVGCSQPKASVFINSWNRADFGTVCVHGFIDGNDGTVYQTLPWNHRGWHCAPGPNGSGMGYTMDSFRKAVKAKMDGDNDNVADPTGDLYRV